MSEHTFSIEFVLLVEQGETVKAILYVSSSMLVGLRLHCAQSLMRGSIISREVTIVRVYIHEGDHGRRKSLMKEIMELRLQNIIRRYREHGDAVPSMTAPRKR